MTLQERIDVLEQNAYRSPMHDSETVLAKACLDDSKDAAEGESCPSRVVLSSRGTPSSAKQSTTTRRVDVTTRSKKPSTMGSSRPSVPRIPLDQIKTDAELASQVLKETRRSPESGDVSKVSSSSTSKFTSPDHPPKNNNIKDSHSVALSARAKSMASSSIWAVLSSQDSTVCV